MKNIKIFDVLIVYSHKIAKSAALKTYSENTPFPKGSKHSNYNQTYEYLLEMCKENKISAAFTTSDDIIGSGTAKSYWMWRNKKWKKVKEMCYSELIFDKFFPRNSMKIAIRNMLLSSDNVKVFSSKKLIELFFDKFKTSQFLSEFSSPTVNLEGNNIKDATNAIVQLKILLAKHPNKMDFSESIILKDRYGAGGKNIFKIDSNYAENISNIVKKKKNTYFILQPFLKFNNGFTFKDYLGQTEIRLIYRGKKIVQTYIRVSGKSDFLCNEGRLGGIRIDIKDVPISVQKAANKISKKINQKNSIFALDFIVSNKKNVYLLEGNSSPGIDWNSKYPENEKMNKEMVNIIVGEFSRRISTKIILPKLTPKLDFRNHLPIAAIN